MTQDKIVKGPHECWCSECGSRNSTTLNYIGKKNTACFCIDCYKSTLQYFNRWVLMGELRKKITRYENIWGMLNMNNT